MVCKIKLFVAVLYCVLRITFSWAKPFCKWSPICNKFPLQFTRLTLGKVYSIEYFNKLLLNFIIRDIKLILSIYYYHLQSHEKAKEAIFYSYNKHINGFAAVLEVEEAAKIASKWIISQIFLCMRYDVNYFLWVQNIQM